MNPLDHALQRLFQAAARAPEPAPESLPSALESRVLARWRQETTDDRALLLAALFRRAILCASLITALSLVWSYQEDGNVASNTVALANYEINLRLPP